MDKKYSELFDNWSFYAQEMGQLYKHLDALLFDLGMKKNELRLLAFISSSWRNEIRFYDSEGSSQSSPECIKTNEECEAKDHLVELFGIKREQAIITLDNLSGHEEAYDEFGMLSHSNKEVCLYGVALQHSQIGFSKIVNELLYHLSIYCRNVLDSRNFKIEEDRLMNRVYTALKSQIDIDFYNLLAASSYEKRVASGGILLLDETMSPNVKLAFKEKYPLEIRNVRQIRKLLEMNAEGFYLLALKGNIVGIGDCAQSGDLFKFSGHQRWTYWKSGKELLSYKEGKFTLIFGDKRDFIADFPCSFFSESYTPYLNSILYEIKQQKHGTMLIIADEAEKEVERLCSLGRGYAITPVDLKLPENNKLLSNITSIDGALFMDTNFICYGVGVILDGIAVKTGLSSRGARYNSAKCYIDNKASFKFAAVVISEDETIDIIHNARGTSLHYAGCGGDHG